jgi:hypothetical protein
MATLDTDFNINPYYDDYDPDKQFSRILFKPSVAVQARELTQLQTILQEQIRRFGNNIYKEGTIVDGCGFSYNDSYNYVKVKDIDANGVQLSTSLTVGHEARGTVTGVKGIVNNAIAGLVSQEPNLNTLYIDYFTTGTSGEKVFSATENIEIFDTANTLVATVTAAGSIVNNAIGQGFAVTCSEGVVFSKGHFLSVDKSFVVVSKYNDTPDMVSVGFSVDETIITSDADSTLLDNAAGFNNETAPGADRLQLSPFLVAIPTGDAIANANFMSIMDFQAGLPVMRKTTTQYNEIAQEMAKRTNEESGSYTVRTNELNIESPANVNAYNTAANTTAANSTNQFELTIGPGLHYVNGHRAEHFNTSRIQIPRAIANAAIEDVSISTSLGQYVSVKEYIGNFDGHQGSTVDLYDTVQTAITDTDTPSAAATGTKIGEARVRSVEFDNDGIPGQAEAVYKVYLFDIDMNEGADFKKVRSLHKASSGAADVVLSNGNAVIQERNLSTAIYQLPKSGLKAAIDCNYEYRTSQTTANLTTNSVTISATNTQFPYSGTLSRDEKREFVLIANKTQGGLRNGQPVNTDDVDITVGGVNNTEATITITGAVSGAYTGTFDVIHNVRATNKLPLSKTLDTAFIKVDTSNNAATTLGPFSTGLTDVKEIVSVKLGSASWDYLDNSYTDVTSSFILNKNCYDNFYGISTLTKRPSLTIAANSKLLIEVKSFKSETRTGGKGFYTISSYKDRDGTTSLNPGDIPVYTSETTGNRYDLRNVVDFRPAVANTGAYSNTVTSATINPVSTESFSGGDLVISAPNKLFSCDIEYYLPRVDRLIITEAGYLQVKHGTPSSSPLPPPGSPNSLSLGLINIPPFPSLTPVEASTKERRNESIAIIQENTARYTMKDIGAIDKRLKRLEYYTALNALETKTADMTITDENGNDRFKSGILVDPCTDLNIADTTSGELRIGKDTSGTMFVPSFKHRFINLKIANTVDCIVFEDNQVIMPNAQEHLIIDQPIATDNRFCTENFYRFNGVVKIDPSYDGGYSEDKIPSKPIVIDTASGINELFDTFSDTFPLVKVDKLAHLGTETEVTYSNTQVSDGTVDIERQSSWSYNGQTYSGNTYWYNNRDYEQTITTETKTVTTTDSYEAIITEAKTGVESQDHKLGDFVKDIQFNPFMRPQRINIVASGLRPNTNHFFFFDEKSINNDIRRGTPYAKKAQRRWNNDNPRDIVQIGIKVGSSGVKTDRKGRLWAVFNMPGDTYNVGDRQLIIMDENDITKKDQSTSKCQTTYSAFNYSVEKTDLTIATRTPKFDISVRNDTHKEVTVESSDYIKEIETTWSYDNYWSNNTYEYTTTQTYNDADNSITYDYEYNYGANSSYKHTTTTTGSTVNGIGGLNNNSNYNGYYGGYYRYWGGGLGYLGTFSL